MRAAALLGFLFLLTAARAQPKDNLREAQQCLVVVTDSWTSTTGRMSTFERSRGSPWQQRESTIPVVVGRAGLGWGRGLMDVATPAGPVKIEGDNRAPAGIFRLRSVFGYTAKNPGTKMPYLALTRQTVGVDDPNSRYYNQLVDASTIKAPDWHSAEKMTLPDNRYKWGVFVEHNLPAAPGAGSCIFLHVWANSQTATAGCTAMPEGDLVKIIRWLDPDRRPLLVQIPQFIYQALRTRCDLPKL
jgi:L,D-peptidoglycan transpeptidase YkuD (ErfK/YbiS/YcfS/YnhG family)